METFKRMGVDLTRVEVELDGGPHAGRVMHAPRTGHPMIQVHEIRGVDPTAATWDKIYTYLKADHEIAFYELDKFNYRRYNFLRVETRGIYDNEKPSHLSGICTVFMP